MLQDHEILQEQFNFKTNFLINFTKSNLKKQKFPKMNENRKKIFCIKKLQQSNAPET